MGRYLNPILAGCHPDPSLCRVGDEFYLVTSTFEYLPGLPIHVSTNLVDWAPIGHAIERAGQLDLGGLPGSCGLFAPTIRHDGERFYVVCTVVGPDDGSWNGRTGHFVVTATEAAGPWSDPIWVDGVGGFDPSLTFDDGRVWLTGTQPAPHPQWPGQTDVWLVELDAESLQPVSTPVVLWHGALAGAVWAEGPHLLPRPGGGWMLVAAEGGTARDHAVCVAYADSITGPYTGDPGNPRLTHRDLGERAPIASVGHADLVDDARGRTWATVLATRPTDGRDGLLGRQTFLVPVDWHDRRPVFGSADGRVHLVNEAPGVPDQASLPTVFDDDFEGAGDSGGGGGGEGNLGVIERGAGLDPAWNGVGRHPSAFARLDARPGHLRLIAGAEPDSLGAQSFLGRRLPADDVDVIAVVQVPEAGSGVRGGLLLRTSERALLELSIDADAVVRCQSVQLGQRVVVAEIDKAAEPAASAPAASAASPAPATPAAATPARVELGFEIRGLSARVTVDGATIAEADLGGLVPDPARGFVGAWVGPFVVGGEGGHIDVDRVTLTVHPEPSPA